jgi:dephospho-CoA kinase
VAEGVRRRRGIVIGLLAGVAGGKTTVARMFAKLGAVVIDADALAHESHRAAAVARAIRRRFGHDIYDARGRLNRKRLAAMVFRDARARRDLESIVHPAVLHEIARALRAARRSGRIAVLDVPLLLETGLAEHCDALVFVDAGKRTRQARAAKRGWERSEIGRRESTQKTVNFKRTRADYIVDNNLSKGRTFRQVREIWNLLEPARTERSRERIRTFAETRSPGPRARVDGRAARNRRSLERGQAPRVRIAQETHP